MLLLILFVYACELSNNDTQETGRPDSLIVSETVDSITCRLPDYTISTLPKNPKRTIVLLTSLLNLWIEAGGKAIARCSGKTHLRPEVINLPAVGAFSNPNVEKIISLQPDLVISSDVANFRALIPVFQQNKIPYAFFRYINYYDYIQILELFSELNGTQKKFQEAFDRMNQKVNEIITMCQEYAGPRVLIVFTKAHSVTCELPNSQTGIMVSMLGAHNILSSKYQVKNKTRIDFSLERIVQLDPDIILLNTMGDVKACRERLKKEFESNAAWLALKAIQKDQFHVLPKKYFLYKPNDNFPKALKYLACLLYPELSESLSALD